MTEEKIGTSCMMPGCDGTMESLGWDSSKVLGGNIYRIRATRCSKCGLKLEFATRVED